MTGERRTFGAGDTRPEQNQYRCSRRRASRLARLAVGWTMLFAEILVSHRPPTEVLCEAALASRLVETREAVACVDEIAQVDLERFEAVWVCTRASGEFGTIVSLYLKHEVVYATERGVALEIARIGKCRCLVDDGSVNPYKWILIEAAGSEGAVLLDAHGFDEDPERFDSRPD